MLCWLAYFELNGVDIHLDPDSNSGDPGYQASTLGTTEPGRLAHLGPMYIKPPMDMVFIRPCTMRWADPLLGAFEGLGPKSLDFFGRKLHSLLLVQFQAGMRSRSRPFLSQPEPEP